MAKIRKAVIPAAGLGTRFLPATKALPKEMMPIVDKPAIQYIIEEIVHAGIEDILIITGRGKRAIEDHFDKSLEINSLLQEKDKVHMLAALEEIEKLADIHYVRQKEALGTGHAILKARKHIGDEPFAVLFGDDLVRSETPCIGQLMALYDRYQCPILGVKEVPDEKVSQYGVVKGQRWDDVYRVHDIVEKPSIAEAPSRLAVLGRFIFTPPIFDILENTEPAESGEIQLTDAITSLAHQKAVYACNVTGEWFTVGDKLEYLKTVVRFSLDREDLGADFGAYIQELCATCCKDA